MIFSARTRANQPNSAAADEGTDTCPQLIIASATLRNHLKKYVMEEKGWIRMNRMVRVTGIGLEVDPVEDGECGRREVNRRRRVTHTALVITNDGGVRNIDGAVPPEQASSAEDDSRTFEEQATDILEGTREVEIDEVQASE
jgi:hypothetical protein